MLSISPRLLPSPTISNNRKSLTPTFSGRYYDNSTSTLQLSGGSGLSLFLTDSRFSPYHWPSVMRNQSLQNGSPVSCAWTFVFNFRKEPHPLYTSQISRNTVSIFSLSGARTSSFPGIRSLSSRIRDRCRPPATGSTLSVTIIMFGLSIDWATHNKRRIRVQIADTTAPPARTNSYHKIVCPLFRFTLYSPASSHS